MAAGTAYLKKRRQGWYFQVAVPADLQDRVGKKIITQTLQTRDLTKAQSLRWAKLKEWTDTFERMRGNVALSTAEIEELAQQAFRDRLIELDDLSKEVGFGPSEEMAQLQEHRNQITDAAEVGDLSLVSARMQAIVERTGAPLVPGSASYRALSAALMSAEFHAVSGRLSALQGSPYEPPAAFAYTVAIDPILLQPIRPARPVARRKDGSGLRFSEAAARYIDEMQRDDAAKVTEQTRRQHEAVFRLFTEYVSDAPLTDITGEMASQFLETVSRLHPDWGRSPSTKKRTLRELLAKYGNGSERLSNRTLNRYVASLNGVFKWAKNRKFFKGQNPFADQSYQKPPPGRSIWLPFNSDELKRLLHSPLLVDAKLDERIRPVKHRMKHVFMWLPLMALFTGMRSGELCQLRKEDLLEDEGIVYFRVHADREGERLKTEAAIRLVPVHSLLIRCGMLDYIAALPSGQLFPSLKPGGPDKKLNWNFSKRFPDFRRKVGVDRPRVCFHSLRKNAAQALKDARATPAEIAELIGHERGFTVETYAPLGLPLPVLKELVERIEYRTVEMDHLFVHSDGPVAAATIVGDAAA
jgi:integrase